MAPKLFVALLLLLPVLSTGVCTQRPREVYVKAGEMVSLLCPQRQHNQKLIWTGHILPEGDLDLTEDVLRRTGLLVLGKSLVVLNASVSHQGNYSCSLGNRIRQFYFRLTVLPAQSPEFDPRTTYSQTCFTQESCTLTCPDVNTPAPNTPNVTKNGIAWHKVGESSTPHYISSVEEKDGGVYTCTRSYLYHGHTYNMTFAVVLDVQPGSKTEQPLILSPHAGDVFHVNLGSALVIDCQAVIYSEFDEVFWLIGDSFVDTNESLPVYYNYTSASDGTEIKMTASLVFREVSEADLSKRYTCKLESDSHPSTFVTICLAQTGVCSWTPTNVHVKTGEMVSLQCPPTGATVDDHSGTKLIWIHHVYQAMVLSSLSQAEQRQMAVLVHGRRLVILNASVSHQGNYSCSVRNGSGQSWFRLTVSTTRTKQFNQLCHVEDSCTLKCPDYLTPAENISGITSVNITWYKVDEQSPTSNYFRSVEENNKGVYMCTRYYHCHDQLCHMTFTMLLDVQPNGKSKKSPAIISPQMGQKFFVDLGSTVVVDCKAVMYSDLDLFWLIEDTFVEDNESLPIFQNSTRESNYGEIKMTTSLVFRNVSEADLLKNYTCKLETDSLPGRFVTICLDKKIAPLPPCYLSLALSIIFIVLFMISLVIVYMKFKITIVLFLRDTLGCHRSSPDGKTYDAFLMCYKSDTDAGLNELHKSFLKSVLEERFGYSLCIYDRDVLPGKATANAVLDCIEQSRTVILVPTSSNACLESGLLSAIHAARVERRSRLVFIQTNAEQGPCLGSVPEALHLLAEAGDRVTWKGSSSMSLSSSFLKQLRYYLPALQDVKKIRLLPQTNQDVI